MLKKAMLFLIKVLSLVLIVLLLAYLFRESRVFGYRAFSDKAKDSSQSAHVVESGISIKEGESLLEIGTDLESKNIIRDRWAFAIGCRFMENYDAIVAGEYLVNSSMKPSEILNLLTQKEESQ